MGEESSRKIEVEKLRREYNLTELSLEETADDPIDQFSRWFGTALDSEISDANAMTLSTCTADGKPSSRIVLIKGFDSEGFRFYTSYESRKGRELEENPNAAISFYWAPLERQVRIEGRVEKLSRSQSVSYFESRPRESQLGAWASSQSSEINSREELEEAKKRYEEKFRDKDIPAPDYWGGYLLEPYAMEFWQGREGRLHDRILYELGKDGGWIKKRLAP